MSDINIELEGYIARDQLLEDGVKRAVYDLEQAKRDRASDWSSSSNGHTTDGYSLVDYDAETAYWINAQGDFLGFACIQPLNTENKEAQELINATEETGWSYQISTLMTDLFHHNPKTLEDLEELGEMALEEEGSAIAKIR